MSAASSDPILESLQRLQPELDTFNKSLAELCRANGNKPEILALCNDLQEYFSKRHNDLLSRYEILKPKEKNQNAVKEVSRIEPEVKQPRKEDEQKKEENKGEDNFGGYSIPKILPVIVPNKMLAFCRGYGQGLLKYLISHKREHGKLRRQLPAALATVTNGASTVLRAMKAYDFSKSGKRLNDSKKSINRKMCISLLECLFPVLGNDENAPVAKYVQDMARDMAKVWRKKMGLEKSLESASKLDIQAFLQLLVTFRIGKDFEQGELCEMLLQIVSLRESPALALFLGLSPKMPDFVGKLSKSGEWIEAIRYAHAFGVMNKIKPADLLKAYLEDTEKAIENRVKKGGKNPSCLLNSTTKEITAINSVIKVVKEYNLEDMFPLAGLQKKLESLQKELERLQKVKEIRMGTGEHNLCKNQRNEVNKKAADAKSDKQDYAIEKEWLKRPRSSEAIRGNAELFETQGPADLGLYRLSQRLKYASEREMNSTADAKSDKQDYAVEKERLKRPHSSEPFRGNAELFETQGPTDLGLYRLSQRVKYASEREMNSTGGDKEKVPHNAGLFQNNNGIYRDDHNQSSYHGDRGSALWPSIYGSGNPGTFVTPSPTVTQTNERRGSDGYPSASGYSNINPVGSSFYGSAQINYEGRGLQSYTPTFGGVDRSSRGSSPYDIDAVANSSGNLLKNDYGRGPESNISTLGGDNLSNVSSSIYGSNWSSDPNNWNGRRGLDQYMLNLGAGNTRSSNSSAYDLGASAVPSSNVYGSGLEQQNSGFASTTSNYGSVASATGVSGQSTINRYQFNSDLRF